MVGIFCVCFERFIQFYLLGWIPRRFLWNLGTLMLSSNVLLTSKSFFFKFHIFKEPNFQDPKNHPYWYSAVIQDWCIIWNILIKINFFSIPLISSQTKLWANWVGIWLVHLFALSGFVDNVKNTTLSAGSFCVGLVISAGYIGKISGVSHPTKWTIFWALKIRLRNATNCQIKYEISIGWKWK